jgi:phosphate transport system substrate-binding protein
MSWEDGTPIRPVLRQPGDDNTRQIRQLSAEIAAAIEIADKRPGIIIASTDQEAADKMETIPGSLGVSTIGLIRSENRRLRALALDGVEPSEDNIRSGRYPLVKRFFFVYQKAASPEVGEFIRFVNSPAGRRVLQQTGHLPP